MIDFLQQKFQMICFTVHTTLRRQGLHLQRTKPNMRLVLRIQRHFRRRPIRFFSFLVFYLVTGSLLYLHTDLFPNKGEHIQRFLVPERDIAMPFMEEGKDTGLVRITIDIAQGNQKEDYSISSLNQRFNPRKFIDLDDGQATYVGCYTDDTKNRALRGQSFFDYKKMTIGYCQENCAERGYVFAGLEFGAECYCGHKIQALNASKSECNMDCQGEKSQVCGGANRISIYRLTISQESARHHGNGIFKGCFRRPDNISLAFSISSFVKNLSAVKCIDICTEKKCPLAVLSGRQCYCGFPTSLFPLHDHEDENLCTHHCSGEDFDSCGNEEFLVVYKTQVQDYRCLDRKFLLNRPKLFVALASFPGAGNTWTRHLIELATGFYTGSFYFDGSLYNKGFKGERDHWRSGRTICIKTHESGRKEIEAFDASILLIRNPYKALIAEFNRKYGGHIGFASQAHWKGKEWPEFVSNYAPWWASHTLDWLKFGKRVHVVHFEELKRNLFAQLKTIVLFLGLEVSEDRLLCVEGQKDGHFKRSGLRRLEYNPYTPEMQAVIDGLIERVDRALRGRQLKGVPDEYRPN